MNRRARPLSVWPAFWAWLLAGFGGVFVLTRESEDPFIRFHALQSVLFSVVFWALYQGLRFAPVSVSGGWVVALGVGVCVFMAAQALRGEQPRLPWLGDVAAERTLTRDPPE